MNTVDAQNILNGMAIAKMETTLNCLRDAEVVNLNVKRGKKRYDGREELASTLDEGLTEMDAMIYMRAMACKALRELREAGGRITMDIHMGRLCISSNVSTSTVSIDLED